MPEIQAFRGLRYDLGHVGSLADVVAPPYDVISPDFQEDLYKKHPCNVVRLILNRQEPGDDDAANNRYTRAARLIDQLEEAGIVGPAQHGSAAREVLDYGELAAAEGD